MTWFQPNDSHWLPLVVDEMAPTKSAPTGLPGLVFPEKGWAVVQKVRTIFLVMDAMD